MQRRTFLGGLAVGMLDGAAPPLRLGMAGPVHGHASGFLNRYRNRQDIELVGIAEPDQDVSARYVKQFRLDPAVIRPSLDEMLDGARPQAVAVFTNTFDHLGVV